MGNDFHPDAHACRLKISAITVGLGENSSMKCPWSLNEEMIEYVRKHDFVSAACRLTSEEELLLLKLASSSSREKLNLMLLNRKSYVTGLSTLETMPQDKSLTIKLGSEKANFIERVTNIEFDDTILHNHKSNMVGSKLFAAGYSRPEEVSIVFVIYFCNFSSNT